MLDGLDGSIDIVDIDLDRRGNVATPKNDKIIIIDADTLVFGTCTQLEYEIFDEWELDIDAAFLHFKAKLDYILEQVGGKPENTELHFTGSPYSFRYSLLLEAFPHNPEKWYKARRTKKHKPAGLKELKELICEVQDREGWRKAIIHDKWEADDSVVLRKKEEGDNGIMCAVDHDLLENIPGRHFNYYESQMHQINMKWEEVTEEEATYAQYLHCIVGDKSDNVPGLTGIGSKKAAKFLEPGMTESEMWEAVLAAYNRHCDYGDPEEMALLNMRLVNVNQLHRKENGECQVILWEPMKEQ